MTKLFSLTCSQSSLLANMQIDKYLIQVGHSQSPLSIENRLCLYWPLSSCKVWDKLDLLCNSKRRSRRCERTTCFVWYLNFKFVLTEKSFQISRQTSAFKVCINVTLLYTKYVFVFNGYSSNFQIALEGTYLRQKLGTSTALSNDR